MVSMSSSSPFSAACAYINFNSPWTDLTSLETLKVLPEYSPDSEILGVAMCWGLCIGIADYVVLVVEADQFPSPRYNMWLHSFFLNLKANPKPLIVLHRTSATTSYEESFVKISEVME
jgi:hypothetical protein